MQEENQGSRKILSLVQYCQRVINANVDAIDGFGPQMAYRLVKPILRGCSADTLMRLERNTPHIIEENEELWQDLCYRNYPILSEQYLNLASDSSDNCTFRELFILLREREAQRLMEAGNRIKRQRLEAEELKRQRQVKLTDKVPPERSRNSWSNGPATPRSLFQKTRAEANKIQRSMLGARMLPPASGTQRASFKQPNASITFDKAGSAAVQVTTVIHRIQSASTSLPKFPTHVPIHATPIRDNLKSTTTRSESSFKAHTDPPVKPRTTSKKDPASTLFIPKHRTYSQIPASAR